MKSDRECLIILTSIVEKLASKLPPKELKEITEQLNICKEIASDGRALWSDERREAHGAKVRAHFETRRKNLVLYLRRNGETIELNGWAGAAKALGVKEFYLQCKISSGKGVAIFKRDNTVVVLGKTRELAEEALLRKFNETGNPDDIPYVNPATSFLKNRKLVKPTSKK